MSSQFGFEVLLDGGGASSTDSVITGRAVQLSLGPQSKSVAIPTPTNTDKLVIFYAPAAVTISSIWSVVRGTSPSATFHVKWGADYSAAGTAVVTAGITVTNTSTGLNTTTFNNAAISAGSFVWLEVSAVSGTVSELAATVIFN